MNLVNIMVAMGSLRLMLVGERVTDVKTIRLLFEEAVREMLQLPWDTRLPSCVGQMVTVGEDRPTVSVKGAVDAQLRALFQEGIASWEVEAGVTQGAWQWYTASFYEEVVVTRVLCEYPEGSGRTVLLSSEERARILREGDASSDYYVLPESEGGRTEEEVVRKKVKVLSWRRLRPGYCPRCVASECRCPPPIVRTLDLDDFDF